MVEKTTIMVVIGYSFPFLNRDIDKLIFAELAKQGTLRKIYYQDPKLDGKELISKFSLQQFVDIVHIQNTDNFHIPFEY